MVTAEGLPAARRHRSTKELVFTNDQILFAIQLDLSRCLRMPLTPPTQGLACDRHVAGVATE